MTNQIDDWNAEDPVAPTTDLRRRAESRLATEEPLPGEDVPEPAKRLIHDLRVHQIELELQNQELRRTQEALERSRTRYFELYDLAPVGYLTLSEAGLIQEVNLAAARLLGGSREALIDTPLTQVIVPDDQDIYYHFRHQLGSADELHSCELRLRRVEARSVWVRLEAGLVPATASDMPPHRIVLIDIDARKRSEQELSEAQSRLHLVAEIGELTFWEWDPNTEEVFFAPEWWRQTGYALGELPLRLNEWVRLLHPEDQARILDHLSRFVETPATLSEIQYRLRCKDGAYRWFMARLRALPTADGPLERVLLVHQDVTQSKLSADQAVHLAQHDYLTGLPSRALLDQLANHMLASARRSGGGLAVLFLDLDRFKAVNDTHGHLVGDQVLSALTHRVRQHLRATDVLARWGGEEFVVLLPHTRGEDAVRLAENLRQLVAGEPFPEVGRVTLSLGVAEFQPDETSDRWLKRVDDALYAAKTAGRNRVVDASITHRRGETGGSS